MSEYTEKLKELEVRAEILALRLADAQQECQKAQQECQRWLNQVKAIKDKIQDKDRTRNVNYS